MSHHNKQFPSELTAWHVAGVCVFSGQWKVLSGNEIGALLGYHSWVNYSQMNREHTPGKVHSESVLGAR